MDGVNSRTEGTKEMISELEEFNNRDYPIWVTERKQRLKQRATGTCGTITKDLTFVSLEVQKEKEGRNEKVFKEIIIDNFQYLERDITLQLLKAE